MPPLPALKELDKNDAVLYMGTFSKVLFPALRVGYLVLPPNLVRVFCHAKWLADRQSPLLEQYVLANFISEGHLERHVRKMRHLYDQRRQALVKALLHHFHQHISIMGENAGMHLLIQLDLPLGDAEVINQANQAGIRLTSANPYDTENLQKGQFILGYAELSGSQIKEGIYRLSQALMSQTSSNNDVSGK